MARKHRGKPGSSTESSHPIASGDDSLTVGAGKSAPSDDDAGSGSPGETVRAGQDADLTPTTVLPMATAEGGADGARKLVDEHLRRSLADSEAEAQDLVRAVQELRSSLADPDDILTPSPDRAARREARRVQQRIAVHGTSDQGTVYGATPRPVRATARALTMAARTAVVGVAVLGVSAAGLYAVGPGTVQRWVGARLGPVASSGETVDVPAADVRTVAVQAVVAADTSLVTLTATFTLGTPTDALAVQLPDLAGVGTGLQARVSSASATADGAAAEVSYTGTRITALAPATATTYVVTYAVSGAVARSATAPGTATATTSSTAAATTATTPAGTLYAVVPVALVHDAAGLPVTPTATAVTTTPGTAAATTSAAPATTSATRATTRTTATKKTTTKKTSAKKTSAKKTAKKKTTKKKSTKKTTTKRTTSPARTADASPTTTPATAATGYPGTVTVQDPRVVAVTCLAAGAVTGCAVQEGSVWTATLTDPASAVAVLQLAG